MRMTMFTLLIGLIAILKRVLGYRSFMVYEKFEVRKSK